LTPPLYAAYARHSDRRQAGSVEQQIAAFQVHAAAHGHIVPPAFIFADRARSGTTDVGRDGLVALMALLEQRPQPVVGVYLWDTSRMGREEEDSAYYRAITYKAGYDIVYVGDESLNNSGEMRHVLEAVHGFKDAQYSKQLGRAVRRGTLSAITKGGAAGRAPKGYMLQRVTLADGDEITRFVPDPSVWDRCKRAWELRAAGASLVEVHEATKLYSVPDAGYAYFFDNPIYLGILRYDGRQYPDFCQPMISVETWDAARAVGKLKFHPRMRRSHYLLSGLVVCPDCGARCVGHTTHGGRNPYYQCRNTIWLKLHVNHMIRARPLEEAVLAQLAREFTPAVMAPRYEAALATRRVTHADRQDTVAGLRRKMAEIESAISNLLRVVEQGGFASVSNRLADREAERARLAGEIQQALAAGLLTAAPQISVDAICANAQRILANGTPAEQKRLVLAYVEAVTPEGQSLRIDMRVPMG
jgi:DNA invertase Pin-like site-specific DNA recombinase